MHSATIQEFYRQIGPAGVVLILISLVAAFLALKNLFLMHFIHKDFRKRFACIESGDKPYSSELHAPENPLISIISQVVGTHAAHSDDLRAEIAYLFHRNFSAINRDITWLKLISVISPLLGLLGTMLGMVTVFGELSGGMANQAFLAGGIMEALNTTIMGLVIAVPALVAYYSLSLKMRGFHIEAIEHSYQAIERFKRNCPAAQEESSQQTSFSKQAALTAHTVLNEQVAPAEQAVNATQAVAVKQSETSLPSWAGCPLKGTQAANS